MKYRARNLRKHVIVATLIIIVIVGVHTLVFRWLKSQDLVPSVAKEIQGNDDLERSMGAFVTAHVPYLGRRSLTWNDSTITVATDMTVQGTSGECVVHVIFARLGGTWAVQSIRKKHCTGPPEAPPGQ